MNTNFRPWSPDDVAALQTLYESHGPEQLAAALDRTWGAVQKKAGLLGLHRRARWSDIDDRRLMVLWDEAPNLIGLARRLKRSPRAVYNRVRELDLDIDDEALTAAERRTGFDLTTIYRIAAWGGVRIRQRLTCPGRRLRRPQHVVDRYDLNDAICKWMAAESVASAARRYGCGNRTILRAVLRAGIALPAEVRSGRQWRIPSDLIDRAMAARQERAA